MRNLSKSKLIAFRQCPKRLWLEVHHQNLREDSADAQAAFEVGYAVGDVAHKLYDPAGCGVTLDAQRGGYDTVFKRTSELLNSDHPIFEAGFAIEGALAFADVMLPDIKDGKRVWHMIEVKSSTGVKDYHRDDAAIQAYIARKYGVSLASVKLAHINSSWVYPGGGDYCGLLNEFDLTAESLARANEVKQWIDSAQQIASQPSEPSITTGKQCNSPFECGFIEHCRSQERQAEYPVGWLPDIRSGVLKKFIADNPALDLRDTPNNLLNDLQLRVKEHTLSGEIYFDVQHAAHEMEQHKYPAYFLDFETIQFAVPIWKGTRPYQFITFQFSLHILSKNGQMEHEEFLDLSGHDPSYAFADALINSCGVDGPIYVYNASFEGSRIKELAARFPEMSASLLAIKSRLVDLFPITRRNYYHPSQQGSWSVKKVLPAVAPDLSYAALEGVQDGGMAMNAYLEAINPDTSHQRKDEIEGQLLKYCGLDTFAMVRLWDFLSGRDEY